MASKEVVPAAAEAHVAPLAVVMVGLAVLAVVLIFVAALMPRRLRIDVSGAINATQRDGNELRALNAIHAGQRQFAARRAAERASGAQAPPALAGAVRSAGMSVSTTKTPIAGAVAVANPTLAKGTMLLATGAKDVQTHPDAVVLVHMEGCGPCRYMRQTLESLRKPLEVPVVAIERSAYVPAREELAARHGIDDVSAFPTLFLLRNGRVVKKRVGALAEDALHAWIDGGDA